MLIDQAALREFVASVVSETVAKLQADQSAAGETLAIDEAEAARLLGMKRHQLRDERLKGRIRASRVCGGKRILYSRDDLREYLRKHQQ